MINYSIVMRGNPTDKTVAKKAYASAQYSEVMDINRFAEHIASHGCVYKRSDIVAILTMSVDCMREQLLAGQKIQLGDLGSFYISINSIGAASAKEFNPASSSSSPKRWPQVQFTFSLRIWMAGLNSLAEAAPILLMLM